VKESPRTLWSGFTDEQRAIRDKKKSELAEKLKTATTSDEKIRLIMEFKDEMTALYGQWTKENKSPAAGAAPADPGAATAGAESPAPAPEGAAANAEMAKAQATLQIPEVKTALQQLQTLPKEQQEKMLEALLQKYPELKILLTQNGPAPADTAGKTTAADEPGDPRMAKAQETLQLPEVKAALQQIRTMPKEKQEEALKVLMQKYPELQVLAAPKAAAPAVSNRKPGAAKSLASASAPNLAKRKVVSHRANTAAEPLELAFRKDVNRIGSPIAGLKWRPTGRVRLPLELEPIKIRPEVQPEGLADNSVISRKPVGDLKLSRFNFTPEKADGTRFTS
jgi:hypothetical protein